MVTINISATERNLMSNNGLSGHQKILVLRATKKEAERTFFNSILKFKKRRR